MIEALKAERERLATAYALMLVDRQTSGATTQEMHDSLLVIIGQNIELAQQAAISLAAIMRSETVTKLDRSPATRCFREAIQKRLGSIHQLVDHGFLEAAWFRASDALDMVKLYLDALEASQVAHKDDA